MEAQLGKSSSIAVLRRDEAAGERAASTRPSSSDTLLPMPSSPTATSKEPSRVSTRTERLRSAALPHGLAGSCTLTEAGSTRCACPPPASFSGADCDSADHDARSSLTQPVAVPLQSVSSPSSIPRLSMSLFDSTHGPLAGLWARALDGGVSGSCSANRSASAAKTPSPTTRIFFMAEYSCQSGVELQPSRSRTTTARGSLAASPIAGCLCGQAIPRRQRRHLTSRTDP